MRQAKKSETKRNRMVLNAIERNRVESCHPDLIPSQSNERGFFVFASVVASEFNLDMADNKKLPFRECKLFDCKGDVSKRWYYAFYCWDAKENKLVRVRDYSISKSKDKAERYKVAKKKMIEVNALLLQGFHRNSVKVNKKQPVELIPATPTLREAFDIIKRLKQATNRKESFKEWKILDNIFLPWCAERGFDILPVSEIKSEHIVPFIDYVSIDRGVSNTTRNNYVIRIGTFFNALKKRKLIEENPLKGLGKLRQEETQHIPYTKEEIQEVKEAIAEKKPWLWLAIQMIYYCFIRPNEIIQLRVRNIEGKVFYIPPEISKGKTGRYIPIHPSLWNALVEAGIHNRGQHAYILSTSASGTKPLGKKTLYNTFVWHMKGKLKQGQDLYAFKHSGVIAAYRATKDIKLIQEYCGHKNIADTDKYLRELGLIIPESRLNNIPSI